MQEDSEKMEVPQGPAYELKQVTMDRDVIRYVKWGLSPAGRQDRVAVLPELLRSNSESLMAK